MAPVDPPFPEPDRCGFLDVNRTSIRTWSWGDEAAPPVICAHGGFDHGRMWDELAPRIAAIGFHVVAIDIRGHGDSGRLSSGLMWTAATIDLLEVARSLARHPGEPVGLIGHSMGGGQALTAATTAPERVAWVVNIDALGPPADAFASEGPVADATAALDAIDKVRSRPLKVWPTRAAMAERRGETNIRLPRRFLDHLVEHGTVEVEGGFVWKNDPLLQLGLPDGFSANMVTAGFAGVTAPVLALMGSEPDTWSDLDDAEIERRIAIFPDARWRSVPDAGHYAHVEQPDVVLAEIEVFLEEIGARP